MKNTLRKTFLSRQLLLTMALALIAVGGAFAQRVGDTVQVGGQSYTIETINGDRITLVRAQTRGDGPVNWTAVANSPFGTSAVRNVAWGNNIWVAVGGNARNDTGKIAYSPDGRSWTAVSNSTFEASAINGVAFGNNMFIAVGRDGKIAYSSDGRSWTSATQTIFSRSDDINGVAFGNNMFVAVSFRGVMATSTDGRNWTAISSPIDGSINSAVYSGNRWVIAAFNGSTAYSTDGRNWTRVAANNVFGGPGSNDDIYGIAFGSAGNAGNRFVVGGEGGKMGYSSNGASWTAVANTANGGFGTNNINGIAFGNNRFAAVGARGTIAYSTDGASWTAVAKSSFGTTQINKVAYGSGRFVAVGDDGKIAYADW
jgi:hypothetical protein